MAIKFHEIPVLCYIQSGEVERGILIYKTEGPQITLENGHKIDQSSGVSFKILETFQGKSFTDQDQLVFLQPRAVVSLGFDITRNEPDIMYPPSTDNWFSKVIQDGDTAVFTLQSIHGKERMLLMITNPTTGEVLNAHLIKPYEANILEMTRDWIIHSNLAYPEGPQTDILRILDDKPPDWSSLAKLVDGITIPNLSIRVNMRETMDQLVPQSFPAKTRSQIMAFLAWLNQVSIPEEDPAEFSKQYLDAGVFKALVNGHLKCMLDNVDPPQYVKIMFSADKGQLKLIERPTPESVVMNPWLQSWYRFMEQFPVWVDRVLNYVNILNSSDEIKLELPVTRKDALTSRKYWSDRFALVTHGLFMRAKVNKEAIGLKSMVYVGGAHKWPHKHIEWSARLGYDPKKQQQIQVMILPHSARERVTRALPTIKTVDWEMSSVNLTKYNLERKKWIVNRSALEKSFERKRTLRQLKNEFDPWGEKKQSQISHEEAMILDIASWGIYLDSLELGLYATYYNVENTKIQEVLDNLKNRGLIVPKYFYILEGLNSICITAHGSPENICSTARAFLIHVPSAHVMITDHGSSCYIVSRIPEDQVYQILTTLPTKAEESGISLNTYPISSYAGYRSNLYKRLLCADGTWDDDISGLLSQSRLLPKDRVPV